MPEHLATTEVHIWNVPLDAPDTLTAALSKCLSRRETERLQACRSEVAARRFALGRGALRHILSRYAGDAPAALTFLQGELGKPTLAGDDGLHFSMTHSLDTALIAIAGSEVGIDMEHARQPSRSARIARRLFHEETVALLGSLHGPERLAAFLDAWTLREAHVKAVGGGLFRTDDVIPFDPAHPADGVPRRVDERNGDGAWYVARFVPGEGLRATLVTRGPIDSLRVHDAATTLRLLSNTNPEHA
jgi:4'-phosphopantetheinyl transferase